MNIIRDNEIDPNLEVNFNLCMAEYYQSIIDDLKERMKKRDERNGERQLALVDIAVHYFEIEIANLNDPNEVKLANNMLKSVLTTVSNNMTRCPNHQKKKLRARCSYCQRILERRLYQLEHGDNSWSTMQWWSLCMVFVAVLGAGVMSAIR